MSAQILCFGAAHVDIKAIAKADVVLGAKIPVSTSLSFGGVARNVAENLSRLKKNVGLVSRVGADHSGALVLDKLRRDGIDARFVSTSTTQMTASFTALIDAAGEMAIALSDMDIYDEMQISDEELSSFRHARMWIIDANLCEAMLTRVKDSCPSTTSLWAVGTSFAKNRRFLSIIDRIDVLVVNDAEAEIFLDHKPRHLVVTTKTSARWFHDGHVSTFPCIEAQAVDATGAGDAFVAGLIYGFMRHACMASAIPYAHACALLTLTTLQTVNENLTQEELLRMVEK